MTLARAPSCNGPAPALPVGQERVRLLYEEYVHYSWLKQVWDNPVTDRPGLEPCFAAAFHGIELAFLQMAEFITDRRTYVAKRPRIEAMAMDIRAQLQLLGDLVDGELEEEGQPISTSLTQDFPFEGCPPTTPCPAHSPGLQRLIQAVQRVQGKMSSAESNSLIKVSLQITSAFQSAFLRWTVGLGIEHQFNTLLKVQGINQPSALLVERSHNLDYGALVRPQVVEATLTAEVYENAEDFFFRSIHLGTECWMFVANQVVAAALRYARSGQWHVAAARVMQAARVLNYLGEHIMTLTRMNLRDYLELKVQLEGTSGAGSSQVRAIRSHVLSLMEPLKQAVLQLQPSCTDHAPAGAGSDASLEDEQLTRGILYIYISCDKHAGLYNYAKALEDVESALLGGFYYKHYCLAANVIGSEARGTMRRAVGALKSSYERQLFPVLDAVRAQLGKDFDAQLSHMKGRMMDAILTRYSAIEAAEPRERQHAMIPAAVASMASAAATCSQEPTIMRCNSSTTGHAFASAAAAGIAVAAATVLQSSGSLSSPSAATGSGHQTNGGRSDLQQTEVAVQSGDLKATGEDQTEDLMDQSSGCPFMSASRCPFMPALPSVAVNTVRGHAKGGTLAKVSPAEANGATHAAAGSTATLFTSSTETTAHGSATSTNGSTEPASDSETGRTETDACSSGPGMFSPAEASRKWLYSNEELPDDFLSWLGSQKPSTSSNDSNDTAQSDAAESDTVQHVPDGSITTSAKLSFLDHAFGEVPMRLLEAGLKRVAEAARQGNASWEEFFSSVLPQASQHVLRLLGTAHLHGVSAPHVHWGHNSHELVWRALSDALSQATSIEPLKVLTTDTEFYSFSRQLNRLSQLSGQSHVVVEVVPAQPYHNFMQRMISKAAEQKPHVVYCSQVTYLMQQALVPDISTFVPQLAHALTSSTETGASTAGATADGKHAAVPGSAIQQRAPVIIIDGYHGFCAVPTDLGHAFSCPAVANGQVLLGYVAGLLKHAGCGPNAAFMMLSGAWQPEPLNTGWLADMSVLAPGSSGIHIGSPVGFTPALALQGSTPAYALAVHCFCALMEAWQSPPAGIPINVQAVHAHVARLQHQFLQGLLRLERPFNTTGQHKPPVLTVKQLVSHPSELFAGPEPPTVTGMSSTLAFDYGTTQQAADVVAHFSARGIAIDARKQFARLGFGFNHDAQQVQRLIEACAAE